MKITLQHKGWQWVALLFLAITWGSSFILMKRGLDNFDNTQVAALRIFIAFISLLPFVFKHFKILFGKKFIPILATGLFGNAIPAFLFTKAQTELTSSLTGMLNTLVPLFTLLLGVFIFNAKTKWFNVIGILIGFVGALGLIFAEGFDFGGNNLFYVLYVIAATICYAISVNIIKSYLHDVDSLAITSLAFLCVGPFMLIPIFTTGVPEILSSNTESWSSLGYIAFLSVVGTSLAVLIFNALIKHTTALFASSVTYFIPVVAMFWGFMDGEHLMWEHLLFIMVILGGVYLVNLKK
jgi:drug/metabolite transporter (DMT)-like permease